MDRYIFLGQRILKKLLELVDGRNCVRTFERACKVFPDYTKFTVFDKFDLDVGTCKCNFIFDFHMHIKYVFCLKNLQYSLPLFRRLYSFQYESRINTIINKGSIDLTCIIIANYNNFIISYYETELNNSVSMSTRNKPTLKYSPMMNITNLTNILRPLN